MLAPYLGSTEPVVISRGLAFDPAEQPLLNGLFYAANVLVIEVGLVLGVAVTAVLWRTRLLFPVVSLGMTLSGIVGAALAAFGGSVGLSPDQRGGMAIVAVTLGGMGALMTFAAIRDLLRNRRRQAKVT